MSGIIRVPNKTKNYTRSDNGGPQDKRLSFGARGILAYILTKPDTWRLRNEDLVAESPHGRDAVEKMVNELKAFGYVSRTKIRVKDGSYEWDTVVYESPSLNPHYSAPCPENPVMVEPSPDKPPTGKPSPDLPYTVEPSTVNPHCNKGINELYEVKTEQVTDSLRSSERAHEEIEPEPHWQVTQTYGPEPEQQAGPTTHSQGEAGAEDSEKLPAPRRISRDDIFRAYPRPAYQNDAVKAIAGAVREVAKAQDIDEQAAAAWLLERTKQYAASPAGVAVADPQDDRRPHPAKWFSGGGYNDIHEWSKPNGNQSRRTSADRRADNLAELAAVRERLEADIARDNGAIEHDGDGSVIEGIVVAEFGDAGNGLSRYDFAGEHAHRLRPQHADWRFDAANGAAMVRALKRQRDADLYAAAALRHVH